jgi:hypothetical protein
MARMTAEQLIDAAVTCVDCGKIHKPIQVTPNRVSWAGLDDGHNYRTRLYTMTGTMDGRTIEALRLIAAGQAT